MICITIDKLDKYTTLGLFGTINLQAILLYDFESLYCFINIYEQFNVNIVCDVKYSSYSLFDKSGSNNLHNFYEI